MSAVHCSEFNLDMSQVFSVDALDLAARAQTRTKVTESVAGVWEYCPAQDFKCMTLSRLVWCLSELSWCLCHFYYIWPDPVPPRFCNLQCAWAL
jgi:hypothetical protein